MKPDHNHNPTWEEMKADPVGKIYFDREALGVRTIILRGPGALCAYFGIPLDHLMANQPYDNIETSVHGGFTYGAASKHGDTNLPVGYYWYGWDYGHYRDKSLFDSLSIGKEGHEWTVDQVAFECGEALVDFVKEMASYEKQDKYVDDIIKNLGI